MYLIENQSNHHSSSDTTNEFEKTILSDSFVREAKPISIILFKAVYFFYRLAKKIGFSSIPKTKNKHLKKPSNDSEHLFTVMMGLDEAKYKPFGFTTNHCRSIFLFDAWEKDYENIISFINKYKIDFVFVTASQSAKKLALLLNKKKVFWVPEGINHNEYKFKSYNEKKTDVLALGRKYNDYHLAIIDLLDKKGKTYLYEKVKGEIVFPTREGFIEGLADTKISICIPSNITHPERAGNVETMTVRYLQSMISKCLIVGHAPQEMIELFGYNPVIEVDYARPAQQLLEILDNFEKYIPLIEKNYKNVIENHTWQNRWEQIKEIYNQHSNA